MSYALLLIAIVLLYPVYLIAKRTIVSLGRELNESKELKRSNIALSLFILSLMIMFLPSVSFLSSKLFLFTSYNNLVPLLAASLITFDVSVLVILILFLAELAIFDEVFKDFDPANSIKKDNVAVALLFLATTYVFSIMLSGPITLLANNIFLSLS